MSFLNPTPAEAAASQILSLFKSTYQTLVRSSQQGYSTLFKTPNVDPQDIVTALVALGADPNLIMGTQGSVIALINSLCTAIGDNPPTLNVLPPGYSINNSSGSVVIVPPAATPPLNLAVATSAGLATISWSPVVGATSYTLQASADGAVWTTVYKGPNTSINNFRPANLVNRYQVSSTTPAGTSDYSSTVTAT